MCTVIKCLVYTYLPKVKDVCDTAQRIKMNCKKIIFLKCLRQFLHFFIQFTKTGWDSTAKRNVILNACFYKTYIF